MAQLHRLKYYSSWFCPFAHRATIALQHHRSAVSWDWEEALGWTKVNAPKRDLERCTEESLVVPAGAATNAHEYYHWKSPGLLAANPAGLIPTLVDERTGHTAIESVPCIEFIDELAALTTTAPPLLPRESDMAAAFARNSLRNAASAANSRVCSQYYQVLVGGATAADRGAASWASLLDGLRDFGERLEKHQAQHSVVGPMFGGDDLALPDITLLPWATRLYIFE